MDKIVLVGAGGHAKACIDVIETEKKHSIYGLVEKSSIDNQEILGYKIVGSDDDLEKIFGEVGCALVTVGQIKSPAIRGRLFETLKSIGFNLPVIASPFAHLSKHSSIGDGSIIMHGAVVNASAGIGKNCIINNKALVEHDVKIQDHCHIATGAIINGDVTIGRGTFIGSGAIVNNGVNITSNCIIGAGTLVTQDITKPGVYIGTPAKKY